MKMAVERLEQVNRLAATQQDRPTRQKTTVSESEAPEAGKESSAQVTLSKVTGLVNTDTSRDINMERVNHIKAQIAKGQLPSDTDEIARQLVNDIFKFS
ncbi:flagellar biosynthesis anti-sigma factor FlgM [Serratia fonticola]|uniref:flagellar biosynthesis anti-sigma factor FlgM n=1 Tax=Serratia fonticola TaxID=47917 RepID=UPI000412E9FA|nr:flagellar biosynthesis anti-sigma factor FlgM [Serratia fonticola]